MAVAAIVATALTDRSVRSKTLTLDGLDLVLRPGTTGNSYGVPIETVHVLEAGPGGVSTMEFTVEDPNIEIILDEGQRVNFWDVTRDAPIFSGFVQSWRFVPAVGRLIEVRCVGLDVLLDWMIIPTLTVPINTRLDTAAQMCVNAALGLGVPLNATVAAGVFQGNQANPIGDQSNLMSYDVVVDGKTLREALQDVINSPPIGFSTNRSIYWIDFYGGLRLFYDFQLGFKPVDYNDLAVTTSAAGVNQWEINLEFDAASVGHAVYVVGANPAGTGLVTDGTGLPGPIAILSDSNSTSATSRDLIGGGYLLEHSAVARGTARRTAMTPLVGAGSNVRAGGRVYVQDPNSDAPTQQGYRIMSIEKTFQPGAREDWTVAYGGHRKSVLRQTRHLTRSTLS